MISKIVVLFFLLSTASAADKQYYFKADSWQKGLHLFAGGGLNGSIYNSDFSRQDQGLGVNFKTDVGYYFNDRFAWEVSSTVKFNYVKEFMIWDTLLTTGPRYRFENFPFTKSKGVYARAFVGVAPTVFYLNDAPEIFRRNDSSRVQYDGPAYGLALGNMYDTDDNNVWFLEYGLTYQHLGEAEGIKVDRDVPVTTFVRDRNSKIKIYSAYVSIGILVF